ncbi:amino acid adenylation domain-containing protein [Amycolatopsis lurida]
MPECVAALAEKEPNNCAIRDPLAARSLTYGELWSRSGVLAAELVARGVRPADVVAVAMDRSAELVIALLGILRAGATYLPLDRHAPAQRLAAVLDQSGAALVVCGTRWPSLPPEAVCVPVGVEGGAPFAEVEVRGEDPCYVAYTSGSTGTPKGVVVPHRAVLRLVREPNYCVIEPGDRVANGANPAFDATTFEIWGTLTAGGTVVVLPSVTELTLADWTALLRDERVTTLFLTTSLFHLVARERADALASLGTVVVGGEQMDLADTRRVLAAGPPRRLVNGYGPTETTTFATYYECTPESLAGLERVPIGFALQNTRLYVLDDELRPVAPGEVGELCVGGPGVALGYLGQPELTAEKFVPEPPPAGPLSTMYRTGDLVRQLPGGALELLGRRDRQVKLRGFRIELEEIERVTSATGLVAAAFVEKIGEGPSAALVGFVLPHGPATAELPARLSAELANQLPDYLIPVRWVVLEELPYGSTGKVDRARLLELAAEPTADAGEKDTEDQLTGLVRQMWLDVLAVSRVSAADNFLELGGNSLLAVQVASRVRERLAAELEPAEVLLADSFGELVTLIRQRETR